MDTLIERYLTAVSELLPTRLRQDTVTEIRSLIQDALDDRSKAEGRAPDEAMLADVLKQFGPPEKIVAPYLPEKYLIGPRLFPAFITVLKIVLPAIAVLALVIFWVGVNQASQITGQVLITNIFKSLGSTLSTLVQAFGNIVFIFAILQWVVPEFKLAPKQKEWDPLSLKAISKPDKIKYGELIVEIFFILVGLIIFNFYFDRIGIYTNTNGLWTFTPVLTTALSAYIPWLDMLWVATIILNAILLRRGAWEVGTRLFAIVLYSFTIGMAASFMAHIQFLYTLQGAMGELGVEGIVQSVLNQVLVVVFVIVIITNAVKIVQMLWRILKGSFRTVGPSVT